MNFVSPRLLLSVSLVTCSPLSRVLSLCVPSFLTYEVTCYLTHSESSESVGALHPAFPTQLCWECKQLLCNSDGHLFLWHNWDSVASALNLQTGEEMKTPDIVSIWNELRYLHLLTSGSLDVESDDLGLPMCQRCDPGKVAEHSPSTLTSLVCKMGIPYTSLLISQWIEIQHKGELGGSQRPPGDLL